MNSSPSTTSTSNSIIQLITFLAPRPNFQLCPHSMRQSRVRRSVCLSNHWTALAAGLLLSAVRQEISMAAGAGARCSTALSSKCGQCHVDSRWARLRKGSFSVLCCCSLTRKASKFCWLYGLAAKCSNTDWCRFLYGCVQSVPVMLHADVVWPPYISKMASKMAADTRSFIYFNFLTVIKSSSTISLKTQLSAYFIVHSVLSVL